MGGLLQEAGSLEEAPVFPVGQAVVGYNFQQPALVGEGLIHVVYENAAMDRVLCFHF